MSTEVFLSDQITLVCLEKALLNFIKQIEALQGILNARVFGQLLYGL
jgi:hypothetical protein